MNAHHRLATTTMFACVIVACGGTVVEHEKGDNAGAGRGGSSSTDSNAGNANGGRSHGGNDGGLPTVTSGGSGGDVADAASVLPPEIRKQPTVWIGESSSTVTVPEVEDLREAITKSERLALILAAITDDESVGGTVTFGDGPPPPKPHSATAAYPPRQASFARNWGASPYAGFEYSIVWSVLKENHLTLAYVPSELFRDWCALQTPRPDGYGLDSRQFCECSDLECHSVSEPINRIDLIVDGDAMGGQLSSEGADLSNVVDVRLKRVN